MKYTQLLSEKRDAALAQAEQVTQIAVDEKRDLTSGEDESIANVLEQVRDLDEQIKRHEELEARQAVLAETRKDAQFEVAVGGTVVKSEARTYSPQAESSFLKDAYAAQFTNDYSAQQRLARHMNEEKIERRDVTSANFAGLIVPQFLTELAAPFARAGRPFLEIARKHQLPNQGLVISISKVTTGSATAVQTEGAAVQETNMDDTKLDVSVVTVAGQQNVSRQALERGTNIDSLVMADLVSAYHTNLESLFVTTQASTSLTNVITQVITYTDASPTVDELYPKIVDGIQRVQSNTFNGPTHIVMHPRRLGFFLAGVDGNKRPLVVPNANGPMNAVGTYSGLGYGQSGQYSMLGLPVITDANVTTTNGAGANEDIIYIINAAEAHLWEAPDAPAYVRFEQPDGKVAIRIVLFGFMAFTAGRYPLSGAYIGGTGLVTPTF